MPHSPRWYRDQLWLLNSGTGFLGTLDPSSGRFDEVAFCPGYLRGMSFAGDFAVVGLSGLRENRTFAGLPLDDNLSSRNAEPRCGLQVIDLKTGDNCTVTISGGSIGGYLQFSGGEARVTIFGAGFNFPYGVYDGISLWGATLTGTLADGTAINNDVNIDSTATVTLAAPAPVPEPSSIGYVRHRCAGSVRPRQTSAAA